MGSRIEKRVLEVTFLVGNGFDKMHGIATSYSDFYIEEIKSSELLQFLRQKGILKIQENKHKLKISFYSNSSNYVSFED